MTERAIIDLALREDRFVSGRDTAINRLLTVVHVHIVACLRAHGLDTDRGVQDFLSVALPGARASDAQHRPTLGRRIVISGEKSAIDALEEDEKFQRLARFYFRRTREEDRAGTINPTTFVFCARTRDKSTPAARRRKLRRLRARAAARGETVSPNVVAALTGEVERDQRPYVSILSGTTGTCRARTLEIKPAQEVPVKGYDLWGFAIPQVA